jgi:hypothetical protein
MRHKILLSLETEEERTPTVLDGVCELDETYVLESRKGSPIPADFRRKARKHGAIAQKRGLSNEYISICTGVERDGKAFSKALNRSEASKEEILEPLLLIMVWKFPVFHVIMNARRRRKLLFRAIQLNACSRDEPAGFCFLRARFG